MSRRAWASVILVAWAVSLGWLARRQLFAPPEARLAEAGLRIAPGATYYRLNVAGAQVGFASSTIDTTLTGIRVMDLLVLRVPAAGGIRRTAALSRAELTRSLRLQSLDVRFDGDPGRFTAGGQLSGDTLLTLALLARTNAETTRVALAHPMLPSMVPLRVALGGELKPGRTYAFGVFDPVTLTERQQAMTVGTESTFVVSDSAAYDSTTKAWMPVRFDTLRAFRLIRTTEGGVRTTLWIDHEGQIVRMEAPSGFTMERQAFELAYQEFRRRDTTRMAQASTAYHRGDVVAATALTAHAPLPPPLPRGIRRTLRVRLTGVALDGLPLAGTRQRLVGDTLIVEQETPAALTAGYTLPARDSAGTLAAFLRPEPLIESTDPRIVAQARQIVGDVRDPAQAASLIGDWVHGHLDRGGGSATLPSAVRVLQELRGDCNEHTLLYVALARAVGLPARTAAGLLYLNGRFYYHAWPEVYLADWVAVDPTLGQFPADAAHLRLSPGALARQAELLPLIGGLKLEVL